ncbi:MAG: hypothetical protein AAGN35_17210 [Bacteroidota bacterium]
MRRIVLSIVVVVALGCARTPKQSSISPVAVNSNLDSLAAQINWPETPIHVQWERFTINDHFNEEGLVAVLHYPENTAENLRRVHLGDDFPASSIPPRVIRNWYSDELRAHFKPSLNAEGNYSLQVPAYGVEAFAKGGLRQGFCFVAGDRVWVYLYSM